MSEFKGTAYQWAVGHDGCSVVSSDKTERSIVPIQTICTINSLWASKEEVKANSLLISKAPEMLDEINESIKDLLCMQVSINEAMKTDSRWEGMYDLLQKQIDRKKELIKSATEI